MSWPHATTTISAKEILGFHPHSSQHHQLYSERPSPRQYNLYRSLSLFIRGFGLYIFPNWSIEVVGSSKWRLFAMFHHGLGLAFKSLYIKRSQIMNRFFNCITTSYKPKLNV